MKRLVALFVFVGLIAGCATTDRKTVENTVKIVTLSGEIISIVTDPDGARSAYVGMSVAEAAQVLPTPEKVIVAEDGRAVWFLPVGKVAVFRHGILQFTGTMAGDGHED